MVIITHEILITHYGTEEIIKMFYLLNSLLYIVLVSNLPTLDGNFKQLTLEIFNDFF